MAATTGLWFLRRDSWGEPVGLELTGDSLRELDRGRELLGTSPRELDRGRVLEAI